MRPIVRGSKSEASRSELEAELDGGLETGSLHPNMAIETKRIAFPPQASFGFHATDIASLLAMIHPEIAVSECKEVYYKLQA